MFVLVTGKKIEPIMCSDTFSPFLTSNSLTIFPPVWHIYLDEWLVFMVNVGKYTSPMDGIGLILCPNRSLKIKIVKTSLAAPRDSTSRGRSSLISVMASSNKPLETLASDLWWAVVKAHVEFLVFHHFSYKKTWCLLVHSGQNSITYNIEVHNGACVYTNTQYSLHNHA